MKRSRSYSPDHRAHAVVCTVSAAALMLGVSQAATVGLHFQVNYCADSTYTGFPVTMTAFGVSSNAWQNLKQMDTGYGCGSGSGPYTLSQVVDTTTSTDGLNPLPNGSLSINWSADTANFSGFAGYGGNPPGYDYGGHPPPTQNPPKPFPTGEWIVYSAFLRDGVNFGPQPGDGYSVDITGLKSLFTNSPYVVELIAASDSMQTITNAFIIDATANTTQSVIYPRTPFPSQDYGSPGGWFRGHGGGLSTVSSSLNTDHLKIIGNRAQNGLGGGYPGFDNASTISGFLITDKPVVSMSPHQVVVCGGDTVVWSAYAAGVPPLSYQWRKNGVPVPGETALAYGITNVTMANIGTYDLVVTNLYGMATSAPVRIGDEISTTPLTNLVQDSNPSGVEHDGLNNGATWLASSTDGASVTRTGVMSFTASGPSQITVAADTNFNSSAGTIMFWMRSSGLATPGGNAATLFDRLSTTGNKEGCVIVQNDGGALMFKAQTNGDDVTTLTTVSSVLADNHWHHVAVVYDQSSGGTSATTIYIDGALDSNTTGNPWAWQPGQELEWGLSHDTNTWQAYNGLMDDVRFYNRALTSGEITTAYGGALVDNNALVMRLNFTTAPGLGSTLTWQSPDAILQSADLVTGPYNDLLGALSPYKVGMQNKAKFFRYRGHTPVVVISNPYLM